MVGNTHFHWEPHVDYVKYGQSYYLLQKLSEYYSDPNIPLLMLGDFNSIPDSSVLSMFNNMREFAKDSFYKDTS
jgi:endonuclease/exonuclease/phosphatase (EEP) superfamily protein YafD